MLRYVDSDLIHHGDCDRVQFSGVGASTFDFCVREYLASEAFRKLAPCRIRNAHKKNIHFFLAFELVFNRMLTIYNKPMALPRVNEFPDKDLKLADFAKALAHPAKLAILKTLARKQECICGELVIDLPLAQSTVSQHLKALKEVGLIKGEVDGPRSRYCIDWKNFEKFRKLMGGFLEEMPTQRLENKC